MLETSCKFAYQHTFIRLTLIARVSYLLEGIYHLTQGFVCPVLDLIPVKHLKVLLRWLYSCISDGAYYRSQKHLLTVVHRLLLRDLLLISF